MKKNLIASLFCVPIIGSVFLTGCTGTGGKPFKHEDEKKAEIALIFDEAVKRSREIAADHEQIRKTPFEVTEKSWVRGNIKQAKEKLPDVMFKEIMFSSSGISLPRIAEKLTGMTGLYVSLASDLKAQAKVNAGNSFQLPVGRDATSAPPSAMMGSGGMNGGKVINPNPASQSYDELPHASNPFTDKIRFQYKNTLEGFLDLVAGRYNISWRYEKDERRIVFYRLASKTFQVRFAGASTATVETRSAGTDSLSKQSTKLDFDSGKWNEIEEAVKGFLSPYGEARILQATGDIVVTDTPMVIEKVAAFVRSINDSLSSQVAVDVKVYSIKISDDKTTGFDLDNLARMLSSGSQIAISGSGPSEGSVNQLVFTKNGGALTGNMILKALSSQGLANQVTSSRQRGLSNQPIPVKVVEEVAYISGETKADQTSTTLISQTDIETDKIEVGFSMVMIPRVYDKNTIMLQMTMELTDLVDMRTYPSSLIETPIVDRRVTTQRAMLNSGETLVLTGFEQTRSNHMMQGTFDKGFWLFGGGKSESKERSVLVVMITPVVTGWQVR